MAQQVCLPEFSLQNKGKKRVDPYKLSSDCHACSPTHKINTTQRRNDVWDVELHLCYPSLL